MFAGRLLLLLSKLTEGSVLLLDRDITMSFVHCLLHFVSRGRNNEKSKSLGFVSDVSISHVFVPCSCIVLTLKLQTFFFSTD